MNCPKFREPLARGPEVDPPTRARPARPPVPSRAGRPPPKPGPYRILGELGRGGAQPVFRARDERLDREVALKVLFPDPVFGASRRERFVREARSLARIPHLDIVSIHDAGNEGTWCWLAMEMMQVSPPAHTRRPAAAIGEESRGLVRLREILAKMLGETEVVSGSDGRS